MAKCAACGQSILFGGVRDGSLRFCNKKCSRNGLAAKIGQAIPEDDLYNAVLDVHSGPCPECQGRGPVDIYRAHFIWSLLLLSFFSTKKYLCCRRCATKKQLFAFFVSGFVGWWGFPFGLLGTPVQLVRNLVEMGKQPRDLPSPELVELIRLEAGRQMMVVRKGGPKRVARVEESSAEVDRDSSLVADR